MELLNRKKIYQKRKIKDKEKKIREIKKRRY